MNSKHLRGWGAVYAFPVIYLILGISLRNGDMGHHHDLPHQINYWANIGIVTGYLLVPFTVLRYLPLTPFVIASGAVFFVTCALTHLGMALGVEHHPLMIANHVVQAISVICFVLGFFVLLKTAAGRSGGTDA